MARWRLAGFNEDCVAWPHGMALAVEFHFAFAFEDVVDLSESFVIVGLGIDRDVNDVQRRYAVRVIEKCPMGFAAGAGDSRQFGRRRYLVSFER